MYERRRPVPWRAFDVVTIFAFWFALQIGIVMLVDAVVCPGILRQAAAADRGQLSADNVVVKLLKDRNPWVVLLCVVSATVAAPIGEEFLFRLVLQGWLESAAYHWRRRVPWLRRNFSRAVLPIFFSALPFAMMHFRTESASESRVMMLQLTIVMVANLLTVAVGIGWLRWRTGATAADLGWKAQKLGHDIRFGLVWSAVIMPPILVLQVVLLQILPKSAAPDPIPLFLFAAAWGFLYYCTHRIAPAMVAHATLNATSLALIFLSK